MYCPAGFKEEAGNCFIIPNIPHFNGDFESSKNVCVKLGAATGGRFTGQLAEIQNGVTFKFLHNMVTGRFNFFK